MNNLKWENIKGKKYAIHCPTKALYSDVLKFFPGNDGRYLAYKENSAINANWQAGDGHYGKAYGGHYERHGYTIIPAEDFLRANTENKLCLNYLIL